MVQTNTTGLSPERKEKKDKKEKKLKRKAQEEQADEAPTPVPSAKKAKKEVAPPAVGAKAVPKVAEVKTAPLEGDAALTDAQYLAKHEISVKGGSTAISCCRNFKSLQAPESLKAALLSQGFTNPSPIQTVAWPAATETGRDILAIAKTGSGKTCGYLVPAMARILKEQPPTAVRPARGQFKGCQVLVMAPTRELAVQIHDQATKLGRTLNIRSVAVYGGAAKGPQIRELQSGAQVVIATPGRLLDMLQFTCQDGSAVMTLANANVLVLDEADRMCDMGFENDIRSVVEQMTGAARQTLFFTATWPKTVQRVAASILNNPIQINVGNMNVLVANKDVKQLVQIVSNNDKYDKLQVILKEEHTEGARVIIFCNKKHVCNDVEAELWESGYSCGTIHGDKTQPEREYMLAQFRSGKMPVLIATDVAARGLDIKGVDRVINYDFPSHGAEDYVHRIGRTGRAGATGVSHTFFTNADAKHAKDLVKLMRHAQQEVPASLEQMAAGGGGGGGRGGRGGYGGFHKGGRGGYGGGGNRRRY